MSEPLPLSNVMSVHRASFQLAAANAQGDLPRNFARDFGAVQADLALRRDFPLSERLHLQFRAEAFNLFNRPNFSNIDNNLGDGPYDPVAHSGFGGAQRTPITRSAASTLFTKSADPARFN